MNQDRKLISLKQDYEVRYWTEALGLSRERLEELVNTHGHGAVVSSKSHHGFTSSKPMAMFDAKTLAKIKMIDIDGRPDGLLYDAFNDRVRSQCLLDDYNIELMPFTR